MAEISWHMHHLFPFLISWHLQVFPHCMAQRNSQGTLPHVIELITEYNSLWPDTGEASSYNAPRMLMLINLSSGHLLMNKQELSSVCSVWIRCDQIMNQIVAKICVTYVTAKWYLYSMSVIEREIKRRWCLYYIKLKISNFSRKVTLKSLLPKVCEQVRVAWWRKIYLSKYWRPSTHTQQHQQKFDASKVISCNPCGGIKMLHLKRSRGERHGHHQDRLNRHSQSKQKFSKSNDAWMPFLRGGVPNCRTLAREGEKGSLDIRYDNHKFGGLDFCKLLSNLHINLSKGIPDG